MQVNGVDIKRVQEVKFLSVVIDDKINWKSQVKHAHNEVSRVSDSPRVSQRFEAIHINVHYHQ